MSFKIVPALALAFAAVPSQAGAQAGFVQPLSTDADALATQMRTIAANPRDVAALVTAGELSLKLDDLAAAASFFARAEKVDPHNARMKAGEAALLVRSERPGEALRYFAQAESYGQDAGKFAADRGLAYDLIGEQERAQRDYRLALKSRTDDETVRRYALSLGISGKREQALDQLAPLLRKSDRGAWRARAFILAMTGDVRGAEKIAATMMPAGMATGLQPFFDRLPVLPAIDRAFAVHFGEVRSTPQRIADARLAPALTPLTPEPGAPTQLAAADPVPAADRKRDEKRKRGDKGGKEKPGRVQLAQIPVPAPAKVDLPPQPPAYRATPSTPKPSVALAQLVPAQTTIVAQQPRPRTETPRLAAPATDVVAVAVAVAVPMTGAAQAWLDAGATRPVQSTAVPVISGGSTPVATMTVLAQQARTRSDLPARSVARAGEDSILARIVAGLSIPASELGVTEPATVPTPVARGVPASPAPAETEASRVAAEKLAAEKRERSPASRNTATVRAELAKAHETQVLRQGEGERRGGSVQSDNMLPAENRRDDRQRAADKKLTTEKAATDQKALAAKKAAADKKALADKVAKERVAKEKKAAKADPERIWVQVSGGANEGDLPKAWAAVKARAPQVFAGRQGYTTPLRATNRVVTGPFKSDDEARAFINALAKKGVSGFSFISGKGQKITKLPAK